jgi:hypothetical protein
VPPHIADHLARHGLQVAEPRGPLHINAEIATVRKQVAVEGRGILEAQAATHLDVEFSTHRRLLPLDWRLIYTSQQRGAIAVYLCEAGSDDGLVACGLLEKIAPGSEFPAWRVHEVGN